MTAPEHIPLPAVEPDDRTGCNDANGTTYLVELHEHAREIVFRDDDGRRVCSYSFATFAGVANALALDFGRGLLIDAATVADLQQWANLDAFGLRHRTRQEGGVLALYDLDPNTASNLANVLSDSEEHSP
ncbi:hypothetical protein [Actinoplanes sp. NPDC026623]|uniref:hypothetical protein n=1 Tax=Actinoplanes sp. NPDC026623 TaxID=3155610 RepID=UPI0033C1E73A